MTVANSSRAVNSPQLWPPLVDDPPEPPNPYGELSRLCLAAVNATRRYRKPEKRANSNACRVLADALDDEGQGQLAVLWRDVADFCDRFALKMYRHSGGNPTTYFYADSRYHDPEWIAIRRYVPVGNRGRKYRSEIVAMLTAPAGRIFPHASWHPDHNKTLAGLTEKFSLPELG